MQSPREWIYTEKRARRQARSMQHSGKTSRRQPDTKKELALRWQEKQEHAVSRKNRKAFAQEGGSWQPC